MAASSDGLCELCLKSIVDQFEVLLVAADGTDHHYRCVHCALVAARDLFRGDLTLRTKSAVKGSGVELHRRGPNWDVSPASALVVALPEADDECLGAHLVLADREEFELYAKGHPEVANARLWAASATGEILSAGKPEAPEEATCPVSGRSVKVNEKTDWTVYKGEVYYFCCAGCKPRFLSNPSGYLAGTAPKPRMMGGEGGCAGSRGSGSGGCSHEGMSGGCGGHDADGDSEDAAETQPEKEETNTHTATQD